MVPETVFPTGHSVIPKPHPGKYTETHQVRAPPAVADITECLEIKTS